MTDTQKTTKYTISVEGEVDNEPYVREQLEFALKLLVVRLRYLGPGRTFVLPGTSPVTLTAEANFTGWTDSELKFTDKDVEPTRHEATDAPDPINLPTPDAQDLSIS